MSNKKLDKLRISEKNKYNNEILLLAKNIQRAEKSNHDLVNNGMINDHDFVNTRVSENNTKIGQWRERVEELKAKIEALESGQLDEEIRGEVLKNTKIAAKKGEDKKKKKADDLESGAENKATSQRFDTMEKTEKYLQKKNHFDMIKDYEKFLLLEVPDYIRENLKTMPNNKGYIWKGNWFFGDLPRQRGPCVMFEKQRDAMYIHEIYDSEHLVFRKVGKDPKELVQTMYRKKMR